MENMTTDGQTAVLSSDVIKHLEVYRIKRLGDTRDFIDKIWADNRQLGLNDAQMAVIGSLNAHVYLGSALYALQRLCQIKNTEGLLVESVNGIIKEIKIGLSEHSRDDQNFDAGVTSRMLVALALQVTMEKTRGTEYAAPQYAVGSVLAELCKGLISAKWTRDQIMEVVELTVSLITSPGVGWEGKRPN